MQEKKESSPGTKVNIHYMELSYHLICISILPSYKSLNHLHSACGGLKGTSDPLELELQTVLVNAMSVLGIEPV